MGLGVSAESNGPLPSICLRASLLRKLPHHPGHLLLASSARDNPVYHVPVNR
jgi:hypothetical protein